MSSQRLRRIDLKKGDASAHNVCCTIESNMIEGYYLRHHKIYHDQSSYGLSLVPCFRTIMGKNKSWSPEPSRLRDPRLVMAPRKSTSTESFSCLPLLARLDYTRVAIPKVVRSDAQGGFLVAYWFISLHHHVLNNTCYNNDLSRHDTSWYDQHLVMGKELESPNS